MKNGCKTFTLNVCETVDCDFFKPHSKRFNRSCKFHGFPGYGPVICECKEAIEKQEPTQPMETASRARHGTPQRG